MSVLEIVLTLLVIFLSAGIAYFGVRLCSLNKNNEDLSSECISHKSKLETLSKEFEDLEKNIQTEMDDWKKEVEKESKEELRIQLETMESNYNEALKEEMENLDVEIKNIDEKLGEKMREMLSKNTLFFTCVCDRNKKIPCVMDLSSDENRFRCEHCGSEYRVEFSAYPILLSNVSSNQTLASMYDDEK